mmetsp:Transcript_1005/g.2615  ORF Transcript_1005/g.2615 Transcript_1005/m.2615 type:complete len:154 (-) Transcript_1005:463-924(-)
MHQQTAKRIYRWTDDSTATNIVKSTTTKHLIFHCTLDRHRHTEKGTSNTHTHTYTQCCYYPFAGSSSPGECVRPLPHPIVVPLAILSSLLSLLHSVGLMARAAYVGAPQLPPAVSTRAQTMAQMHTPPRLNRLDCGQSLPLHHVPLAHRIAPL